MVKTNTRAASTVDDTRRSTRIQGRTVTGQAASANATAANPVKSRPVRQVRQKKLAQKTAVTTSDRPRRNVTAARSASVSTQHKRKRKGGSEASTSKVNPARPTRSTTVGRRHSKKVKFTQVEPSPSQIASTSRDVVSQQPSIATVQETQIASSVVIQDTTVPQVTTTTIPIMQSSKKRGRGRPPTTGKQSRKRGHNAVDEDHRLTLKPKRPRKWDTFTVPIPTRSQQVCQVYAIGSNEFGQCGREEGIETLKKVSHVQVLDQFNIVDISAGSLHNAALTVDGKIVTWGCNDHGTLGRFTDNPSSEEAREILEAGNYIIGDENKPAYAEGLNNVNIVKVVCGGNATFAISDDGHLYATGTFKGKDGIIGFSYGSHIKQQPIFTRYTPFEHLTIVNIAASVDHALALTKEGDVYAWGNSEAYRLGKKFSIRKSPSLEPVNLGLRHIERLYVGAYHNFVVNNNEKVKVFGFNNMGQCGLGASKQVIVPPENHLFFNKKIGQKVKEFAAGEHHTLALMEDGRVFSFGRSDYGQLGLGDSVLPSANEAKSRVVIPTVISSLTSIKLIGVGDHFSMAVDAVNKIYAWGFGEYFVLGNKVEGDVTSPFQMPNLNGKEIVHISCGSSHALFLIVDSGGLGGDSMDVDTN